MSEASVEALQKQHPIGSLAYHDYAALLALFDDSQFLRMGRCLDQAVADGREIRAEEWLDWEFDQACQHYRSRVSMLGKQAWNASRPAPQGDAPELAPYLYNPACLEALGNADKFAMLLVDDVDPLQAITADCGCPVEQITFAFCPTLESLGLPSGDESPFGELHELLVGRRPVDDKRPVRHPFEERTPLLVYTKYKAGCLATLGLGGLVQEAIFRAMGRTVERVLGTLAADTSTQVSNLMTEDSIRSVKRIFLDPQGLEDYITLIACTNYSVAISLVVALRNLCFRDLEDVVREQLDESAMHRELLTFARSQLGLEGSATFEDLADNHLFSKTYTTLAASRLVTAPEGDAARKRLGGMVRSVSQVDVGPGHLRNVVAMMRAGGSSAAGVLSPEPRQFLVGRHDFAVMNYDFSAPPF